MIAYGKSDKGRVRPTNQDAFAIDLKPEAALIAVCDGMGGANAGNVASKFAIESFMDVMRQSLRPQMDRSYICDVLTEGVASANRTVFDLASAQPEFRGMGTTLVGGMVTADSLILVNVGDSRAYRIGKNGAERLTKDHSYVEEMLRRGKLTEEAARRHPHKNLITRAVGIEPEVDCDLYEVELAADDILLLCSDGLSGLVRDEEIANLVHQARDLQSAVESLIDRALNNGGADNVTALLLKRETPEGKE
ncbi:MAG: Stp1/IreP family PP2C-type Ser/Thr phosphatase [Intestinibacillus sp.]